MHPISARPIDENKKVLKMGQTPKKYHPQLKRPPPKGQWSKMNSPMGRQSPIIMAKNAPESPGSKNGNKRTLRQNNAGKSGTAIVGNHATKLPCPKALNSIPMAKPKHTKRARGK